ncbi:MAG TPA: hypothetical protein VGG86_22215 [Roseiarcus sp.]|jgi:hypothetical protein
MHDLKWSASEKTIARRAYEAALETVLAGIMSEFKARAAAAATSSDMWAVEDYLRRRRREVDDMFDYRYSRLLFIFAQLIDAGHLDGARLAGLSEEKLAIIRSILSRSVSARRRGGVA